MKILVADDDAIWRRMIEATVRTGGQPVLAVGDGTEAWCALEGADRPSLAILDWMMPGVDGLEICRRLRAQTNQPYVYVLLLTAKDSKDDLVQAFEAGADDFITKPFDPEELRSRLRAATRILDLQSALLKAQEDLHVLASRDGLTGLFNRRAILETLDRELARSHRDGGSVSVLIADVDHFKRVNDNHGHAAGDAVLVELAERMKKAVRTYDSVGRYGGEEMLIVLPDCDEDAALNVAERTRESTAARACIAPSAELQITLSLGVASTRALGTFDPKQLIHAADTALYRAKNSGRNRSLLATRDDLA